MSFDLITLIIATATFLIVGEIAILAKDKANSPWLIFNKHLYGTNLSQSLIRLKSVSRQNHRFSADPLTHRSCITGKKLNLGKVKVGTSFQMNSDFDPAFI